MSADKIYPGAAYAVREGERLEAAWKANHKLADRGNPRTRENALARLIKAGSSAHRVVRDHAAYVLEEVESASYRYVCSVISFDDEDLSAPSCTSILMWTNSMSAMKFCSRLQVEYRHKTGKFDYDIASVEAVLSLYRELKKVGNRALAMACYYQTCATFAAESSEHVELLKECEPDLG